MRLLRSVLEDERGLSLEGWRLGDAADIALSADGTVLTGWGEGPDGESQGWVAKWDVDSDGDGISDDADNCPETSNPDQADTDDDGQGDACDADDDNDGVPDDGDAFPFDASESVDTDGDGIGNNADLDDDNDGFTDAQEVAAATDSLDAESFPHGATGQPLVFSSDRSGDWEIYLTDSDGTSVVRLTDSPGRDNEPALSPDGSKVAFHSERDGNMEIYVINADGTNLTRLTNNSFDDYSPKFSPDGTKIVFDSYRSGNIDILIMNADGSSEANLTQGSIMASRPEWSPDERRIAFSSGSYSTHEIVVMDADGTNRVFLTDNDYLDYAPAWSPDGSKLLYFSEQAGNREIHVMDVDGSNVVNLTNHSSDDAEPAWSGDGLRIVFQSDRDGDNAIFVMNADGSGQVKLIDSASGEDHQPHWAVAPVNLEDGLVAHYLFSGNANDASGNGNHGVVHGATPTTDRFGNANSAYSFDGVDDFIDPGSHFAGDAEFSQLVWVKPVASVSGGETRIIQAGVGGIYLDTTLDELIFEMLSDRVGGTANGTSPSTRFLYQTPASVAGSGWYHLALVGHSNNDLDVYINGTVAHSGAGVTDDGQNSNYENSLIGAGHPHQLAPEVNYKFFAGSIDDVRIYNRALSAEEVAQFADGDSDGI